MSPIEAKFGKYHLVRRLADVEMGEVHLASLVGTRGFKKRVMIWRVDTSAVDGTARTQAMISGATQGAALSHASIAQVLELGVVDGMCFVATEYVPGPSLEAVLRVRPGLPWSVAGYIGCEAAGALSYAHSRRRPNGELLRLVHRRLSPARIALDPAGNVKVTGFGTSWACKPLEPYRAPEETRNEPVDGRADVFALGVILQRCLRQRDTPEPLERLLERATHAYPEQRPSAAELHRELVRIVHRAGRPVGPRDIATLVERSDGDALFEAIERTELTLDSMKLERKMDTGAILHLYERLGRLCIEAQAGERGSIQMTRALDLADGLGRDDYAALFCHLQSELLMQSHRMDESGDWLERAATFRH